MSQFKKLVIWALALFISCIHSTYAMKGEDIEAAARRPLLLKTDEEDIRQRHPIRETEVLEREEESSSNPPFEIRENNVTRDLNRAMRSLITPAGGKPYFGVEYPPLETAVIVYNPSYRPSDLSWDNPALFLEALDNKLFKRPVSFITRGGQLLLIIPGSMAAWGLGPLFMYLTQQIVWSPDIPYAVDSAIVFSTIGVSTIPLAQAMWERGKTIGNALVDYNGFTTSKSDKKPHIRKLSKQVELPCKICGKPRYLTIPIQTLCRLTALAHAAIQTSVLIPLFYDAEREFIVYFSVFVGPLALSLFEKAYYEALQSLEFLSHSYFTNQIRMEREKKEILMRRLLDLRSLVNAKGSDNLVNELYTDFQLAMNLHEAKDPEKRISAASLFFLKRTENATYAGLREMIEEASRQMEARRAEEGEHEIYSHSSMQELEEMNEGLIQTFGGVPIAAAMHLIEDIGLLPGVTTMRRLLEYLAVRVPGIAETGRFLIPLWAIPKIFSIFGLSGVTVNALGAEIDPIFTGAVGVSIMQLLIRAASEWYLQNESYLQMRRIGSTSTDFWPFRWIANGLSLIPSTLGSLAGPSIIFMLLGDSPIYLKVILSAAMFPGDMTSFYRYFSNKYGNFIRNIGTIYVRSTPQKRAVLNREIDNLSHEILRFDSETTNEVYKHIEKGL